MTSNFTAESLQALPGELIDHVCTYLFIHDIHNLRVVCKDLHAKADHQFAVYHFRCARFMFTRESLDALIALSKNSRFAPAIKELQLVTVTFPPYRKQDISGNNSETREQRDAEAAVIRAAAAEIGLKGDDLIASRLKQYRRQRKQKRRSLYDQYMHLQGKLRKRSIDVELLAEALRGLVALESISLVDQIDRFHPPRGLRKIVADIGIWPVTASMPPDGHEWQRHATIEYFSPWNGNRDVCRRFKAFCAHSIGVILGAILKSGIKLKGSLSLDGATGILNFPKTPTSRKNSSISTPATTFNESQIQELKPALRDLNAFALKLYDYSLERLWNNSDHRELPCGWLSKYFPLMPSIERLSITGANIPCEAAIFDFFADPQLRMSHLRTLNLKDIHFSVKRLCTILINHTDTLEHLRIMNCKLYDGDYRSILGPVKLSPAMLSIELFKAQPANNPWYYTHDSILRGPDLKVEGETAPKFQLKLESAIDVDALAR